MRVGELARRTGVGESTLRAWERRFGILEPARSSSGQRLYTEADVERVSAVCRLVAEGLTLSAAVTRVRAGGNGALPDGESDSILLHQVMETADQGIWVTDSGRTRYVNRKMAELMGSSVDELVMRPALDFVDPDFLDTVRDHVALLRAGHRLQYELPLRRLDGSSFVAEVRNTPLRDGSGSYQGSVAVVADVTARNEADREARFRNALLDAIGEAVLATLPDGTIVYGNPAVQRLLGWTAAELIGENGLELLSAGDGPTEDGTRIHSTLLAKKRHTGDIILTRRDGTQLMAHMTGSPVLDARGELVGLIGILSDNSEANRLELRSQVLEVHAETIALLGTRALHCKPAEQELVVTETVEATRRVLQSDYAALSEFAEDGSELVQRASSPPFHGEVKLPSGSRSFTGYTALAGKVVVCGDLRRERRFDVDSSAERLGILSAIAAPVFGPSGVLGILLASSREMGKFDSSAVDFMQSMANIAGVLLRPTR
jgi:PAS domain S-box-containing protein